MAENETPGVAGGANPQPGSSPDAAATSQGTAAVAPVAAPAAQAAVEVPAASPAPAAPAPDAPAAGAEAPATPEAASAPAEAAKPADGEVKPEPSLLETVAKPEDKPAAVPEPPKPAEAAPAYQFKLPDGMHADPTQMGAYSAVLGENKIAPEVGQKLIDMHVAALNEYAAQTRKQRWDTFAQTRRDWRNEIMADEEIGGAGFETTKLKVAQVRDLLWKPDEQKALNDFLAITGAGDHPVFWKGLARMADRLTEPSQPAPAQKPAPDAGKAPGGERRKIMYDNPASSRSRG